MLRILPLPAMSLTFAFLLGISNLQAQDNVELKKASAAPASQCTESCFGLFKTCTVEIEDAAVEKKNACEISVEFSCDGPLSFLTSVPRLTNIFGNLNTSEPLEVDDEPQIQKCEAEVATDCDGRSPAVALGFPVKPVAYHEAIPVPAANSAELLQGLMQARIENARLEAHLESLQRQGRMIEELVELRAKNEMLEELSRLRTENVELKVRLEMAERGREATRRPSRDPNPRR